MRGTNKGFEDDATSDPASDASAYLARDRLSSLAKGAPLPELAHGTAVLADIAGFTALTEFLYGRHGPRDGAEILINYTNQVYTSLIREVERFGGSVIDFAGDAILCWFDGEGEAAQLRAIAVGLAMRDSAASWSAAAPDGWSGSCALKVAIAAGPARRLGLGNPDIQRIDAIAGTAIVRLTEIERLVRPGEVVADRASLAAADRHISWDPDAPHVINGLRCVPPQAVAVQPPSVSRDLLLPWIPAPIRQHIHDRYHKRFLCEIRRAAVMFVQFDRRDYQNDTEAVGLLDTLVQYSQQVAHGLGGNLLQLSLNEKGSYLYLVFGAPIAHENAVARAVRAAHQLLSPHPATIPFGVLRAGIASGYARIGIYGAPQRQAYGVIGGPVNLAARLMEAARPGELLAPASLAAQVPGAVTSAHRQLRLKGFATPCEVAGICSGAPSDTFEANGGAFRLPPSDRISALTTMDTLLERLESGRGGCVLVDGEPGMGKTVLLHTAIRQARARGIGAIVAGATELEQTSLYAPWSRIFAALFPDDAALATSVAALDGDLASAAPMIARALHRGPRHDAEADDMAPQLRAHRTREALGALVAAAAQRARLVVALDDVHWSDSASLSLAAQLARSGAPLLMLMSTRTAHADDVLRAVGEPNVQRIRLEPMPAETLLKIACSQLGVHAMSAEAARLLLKKAGGNPFFAQQLALTLHKLGTLEVTQHFCRLSTAIPSRSAVLPDSIEGIVTARLDRLTPQQLRVAKLASAIGSTFDGRLLDELHGGLQDGAPGHGAARVRQPAWIDARLAELAALDILEPDGTAGGYRFRHAIVRDVVYHLMLSAQRSELHRWLARWYEDKYATRLDAVLPVLSAHWYQVVADPAADQQTLAHAIELLHRAALQAFHANALGEAAHHLQCALSLLARRPAGGANLAVETEYQSMLGYCLSTQRGFGDAAVEQAYRRGYALAQQVDLTAALGFPLYGLFSFYASRAEYRPAQRLAEQMLRAGEAAADPALCAFARHSAGIIAFLSGDMVEALASLDHSARLAGGLASDAFLGFASELPIFNGAWQILALANLERFHAARQVFASTLDAAARAPHARAFVLSFAMLPVWEGDIEGTLCHCDELDALSQRHGFDLYAAMARTYRGWALAMRDGTLEGAALAESGLPLLRAVRIHSFLPMFLGLVAQAHLCARDYGAAQAALDEARALSQAVGAGFYGPHLSRLEQHLPSPRRFA